MNFKNLQPLPQRKAHSNKSDAGHLYILGGNKGLYGSAILSALAGTRTGAGYTHLISDAYRFHWLKFPDMILHDSQNWNIKLSPENAFVVGPGLGTDSKAKKWLSKILKLKASKLILDADALTLLSKYKTKPKLPKECILTPHEGEMARLIGKSSAWVKSHRKEALELCVKIWGCHALIKGSETLMASPNGTFYIYKNSTPALAKAGTGDVLAGILGALRSQQLKANSAMIWAVHLHSKSAKTWLKTYKADELSLRPTDLIETLPQVILKERKSLVSSNGSLKR